MTSAPRDESALPDDLRSLGQPTVRPLAERLNKVSLDDFPRPDDFDPSIWPSLERLFPRILTGKDFPEFLDAVAGAIDRGRPVLMMLGGHVVKTGMNFLIADLVKRGALTWLAANGSVAVHDWELALIGATSEDVGAHLEDGRFGLWEETGGGIATGLMDGLADKRGHGEALGLRVLGKLPAAKTPGENTSSETPSPFPHAKASIMAACAGAGRPMTIHSAFGAEIVHEHPACRGSVYGAMSERDFHRLTHRVAKLEGGVAMNWGSAVIMPEVFLKALAVARNHAAQGREGVECQSFTNASFDFIRQYRPLVNVVERPTKGYGKGYLFTGCHEVQFPLFYAGLRWRLEKAGA
jgi:hypothetical protein